MTVHSFVDESKESTYLLVAALIRPANVARTRQAVAAMVLPRQRRIHFCQERDSRRAQIMSQLVELPIEAVIYEVKDKINERRARDRCLLALVRDHMSRDVRRLVLERDDSHVESDRRLLRNELLDAADPMAYEHVRAHEEPLLAIPDAIAWCRVKGGHWRVKAKQLVGEVQEV